MNTKQLYQKYQIMPQLETHMLRVAGVGKLIADNWISKCDSRDATNLCLLHDMGNIVKFDLSNNEAKFFGEIENIDKWREVQADCKNRFGSDAHTATIAILKDAGLEKYTTKIEAEEKLYFSEANESVLDRVDPSVLILLYSDCRVMPNGVVSYRERINDLCKRYGHRPKSWQDWTYFFEGYMQKKTSIDLMAIDDAKVEALFDELLVSDIE